MQQWLSVASSLANSDVLLNSEALCWQIERVQKIFDGILEVLGTFLDVPRGFSEFLEVFDELYLTTMEAGMETTMEAGMTTMEAGRTFWRIVDGCGWWSKCLGRPSERKQRYDIL